MSEITIRPAEVNDIPTMAEFQVRMAAETEGVGLEYDLLCKGMETVFENPAKGRYFVAVCAENVVGSLMITYEWSEWRNRNIYWIQSVFVMPEYRQMGVYSNLYKYVKSIAENDSQVGGIRLYVDNSNYAAQEVYRKLGMDGEHYKVFEWMKD